jgi:hypothetical protein
MYKFSIRFHVWEVGYVSYNYFVVYLLEVVDFVLSCCVMCCVSCSRMHMSSRCACVFELVGCVLSCCVLCCVCCSRMHMSSRCADMFELVGCVLSCCVLCCMSCCRMHVGPLVAHVCLSWWVVFSLVCCAACLVLECLLSWAGSFFYNVFMFLSVI